MTHGAEKMVMCSMRSEDKAAGRAYDESTENATHCPNCASDFCRKFYFEHYNPTKAEVVLRWAASTIIHEKETSKFWGSLDPANDIRAWMYETIKVFHLHSTGIGKYVSHVGTTRMNARGAANAMFQGQGKQLALERLQVFGSDGKVLDFYPFSFDHGKPYVLRLHEATLLVSRVVGADWQ